MMNSPLETMTVGHPKRNIKTEKNTQLMSHKSSQVVWPSWKLGELVTHCPLNCLFLRMNTELTWWIKRKNRIIRVTVATTLNQSFPYSHCKWICLSWIQLIRHHQSCSRHRQTLSYIFICKTELRSLNWNY